MKRKLFSSPICSIQKIKLQENKPFNYLFNQKKIILRAQFVYSRDSRYYKDILHVAGTCTQDE